MLSYISFTVRRVLGDGGRQGEKMVINFELLEEAKHSHFIEVVMHLSLLPLLRRT